LQEDSALQNALRYKSSGMVGTGKVTTNEISLQAGQWPLFPAML